MKKILYLSKKNRKYMLKTRFRVLVYFVAIMFTVFFVFNALFYKVYSDNTRQVFISDMDKGTIQTQTYTDLVLKNIENVSDIILVNEQVQKAINKNYGAGDLEYEQYSKIISNIENISYTTLGVSSILLYFDNSEVLLTSNYGLKSDLEIDKKNQFLELEESIDKIKWITSEKSSLFLSSESAENPEDVITMLRPIRSVSTGQVNGLFIINLKKQIFRNLIKGSYNTTNLILDEKGKVVTSVGDSTKQRIDDFEFIGKSQKVNSSFTYSNEGTKYMISLNTSKYTGWKYVSYIPVEQAKQPLSKVRNYLLLLLVINFAAILLIIWLWSKKIFNPVNKLIFGMQKFQSGDFNVSIEETRSDEYGYLYTSFNEMVGKIKTLFTELYEEKLLKKEAELKLLQSKINPHFIYNIFDNMNWLIQLERYGELENLVDAVVRYYKTTLNFGKDYISVRNTLEQLKSYSGIQMIRFKNRFTTEFDFDKEILEMTIPNLMLQPLLENAICHGIEPKVGTSSIVVSGKKIGEIVRFAIEDNGVGINSERLKDINDKLNSEGMLGTEYFALVNLNKRIKLAYGENYGISIFSQEGTGTCIVIKIPFETGGKHDV